MKKIVVLAGIFLAILVIAVSATLLVPDPGDTADSCPPPPTSIFRLANKDLNQSHSVSVIINDGSNTTLANESYDLAPGESTKSTFVMTSQNATTTNSYCLIFTVDDSVGSEISVNVSYYAVPELHIDPTKGGVIYYSSVLTGDYGCPLEDQGEY
ncbi:hypothetical protein Mpet_0873 [Methanolacinia petrolearia DSM 11571]|uniref:Uncharacterized protein n=1 Tax=Methanolacinia petrolearia (strain DSM 11571 / OCM 486 / SEBR 4847) TaxID=679926 RepID=E1RJC4_METP4|nr:hypothetical protein [Methanolacinia petrolearia]ADN35642.1 hypothetical protein Mpet_0873 [Methanolacinia petrolearia DSM 11571]